MVLGDGLCCAYDGVVLYAAENVAFNMFVGFGWSLLDVLYVCV